MEERFCVLLYKGCNKEKLMHRFKSLGFSYLGVYKDRGLVYSYDPNISPPQAKRHNKPGQGRHKKKLLKADGSEYTCGDVFALSSYRCNTTDQLVDILGISETTYYARRKVHKEAGEYYKGSTVPF